MLSTFVSSAVFKELVEALPQLWYCLSVISGENFENFSDISAISEEIYFRLPQFNPFPNKPWFLRVCSTSLLKTLWEKEKLLVTSNFSFSHSVFYLFGELSPIFVKIKIVV